MVAAEYIFYHLNASSSPEIAFLEQILKIKFENGFEKSKHFTTY